jgi:hypothetical protein
MPFDSEWPGDAAAAPFCGTSNREDASIESPGGRTWDRLDGRAGADEARPPRDAVGTDNEPTRFAGSGVGWITSIGSIIAERSGGRAIRAVLNAAAGAIPFVGGALSAGSAAWSEREQEKINSFFEHWLKMQRRLVLPGPEPWSKRSGCACSNFRLLNSIPHEENGRAAQSSHSGHLPAHHAASRRHLHHHWLPLGLGLGGSGGLSHQDRYCLTARVGLADHRSVSHPKGRRAKARNDAESSR